MSVTHRSPHRGSKSHLSAQLFLLPLLLTAGCADGPAPHHDMGEGTVTAEGLFPPKATTNQRFGFRIAGAPAAQNPDSHGPDYEYDTPAGWAELPPSQFRQLNFQVAGDADTTCYLTVLAGNGGGLTANVNRWRQQMKLAPLDEGAIAALPKGELMGAEATAFDATGTFAGMGGDGNASDSRMIGLLAFTPSKALFLKMIGPAGVVTAQEAAFHSFASSLKDAHAGHNHGPAAAASDAPAANTPPAATAPANSAGGLAWDTPEGWEVTAPRVMRLVNFAVGGEAKNQCYISMLGGDGGGILSNINRWQEQMGQPDISAGDIPGLETIPMLDGSALIVEIEGSFRGMGDDTLDDALMMGAIRELPESTVFVKMIGDKNDLADQRDNFIQFCQSIRLATGG